MALSTAQHKALRLLRSGAAAWSKVGMAGRVVIFDEDGEEIGEIPLKTRNVLAKKGEIRQRWDFELERCDVWPTHDPDQD